MQNSSILVTGGTGSFGNAFAEHVLKNLSPKRLVIYSRDEYKQYTMAQKLGDHPALRFFIGDVRDEDRLNFAMHGIDYVFHAAALKQVVSAEYNPTEALHTNAVSAEKIIKSAIRCGVKKVLGISTDKAVRPINLYGATKACMERIFIAGNHMAGASNTRFGIVRYGNVIGSRGSVISLFRKQVSAGKKLTITDKRMTRFWLRIEDGVKFALESMEMMRGGECFVRKCPSMQILDCVEAVAPGCGINYIGIRPGEKLHEEMIGLGESQGTFEYSDRYIIQPAIKMWGDESTICYMGEEGKKVPDTFTYSSLDNDHYIRVEEMRNLVETTRIVLD
jgi:UDP-N-acetylglucosamine 4,6-dehydratase/5-epimerase